MSNTGRLICLNFVSWIIPIISSGQSQDIQKQVTVLIETQATVAQSSVTQIGAGVCVGRDQTYAYILTANHVLRSNDGTAFQVRVTFYQAGIPVNGQLFSSFSMSEDTGVVTIPVSSLPSSVPILTVRKAAVNDPVYVIGFPSAGNWSSYSASVQNDHVASGSVQKFAITASPSLSDGYSGGPVFDGQSRMLGIHTKTSGNFSYGAEVKASTILDQLEAWNVPHNFLNDPLRSEGPGDPVAEAQLFDAISRRDNAGVSSLIQGGPKINFRNAQGTTPLIEAVRTHDAGLVSLLLTSKDVDPNFAARDGSVPIDVATDETDAEIVKVLLKRKDCYLGRLLVSNDISFVLSMRNAIELSPNFHPEDASNILHKVAVSDVTPLQQQYFGWLASKASTNIPSLGTLTAEYKMSTPEVLRLILNKFAFTKHAKIVALQDELETDSDKYAILLNACPEAAPREIAQLAYSAAVSGAYQNLRTLLSKPIDINEEGYGGPTILLALFERTRMHPREPPADIVKKLIALGVDVNAKNDSETVLMRAAEEGNVECVRELLKAPNIHVNARVLGGPTSGWTALDYSNDNEITKMLKAHHGVSGDK